MYKADQYLICFTVDKGVINARNAAGTWIFQNNYYNA